MPCAVSSISGTCLSLPSADIDQSSANLSHQSVELNSKPHVHSVICNKGKEGKEGSQEVSKDTRRMKRTDEAKATLKAGPQSPDSSRSHVVFAAWARISPLKWFRGLHGIGTEHVSVESDC